MLSILVILLLALLFSLISLWRDRHPLWLHSSSSAPLPPSLPWLPILGSLLSLPRGPPHLALTRLAHAHGPVLGLWLGSHRAVVVSGAQEVHEVLIGQGRVFGGRPPMVTTDILTRGGQDIAFANYGPAWRLHRKIVHASLYKGGFGMDEIEAIVSAEAKELCAGLLDYCNGQSLDFTSELTCAVTNIVCALTFSSRYRRTDPEFVSMLRWNEGIVRTVARDAPVDIFPWLRFLPLTDLRSLRACVQERDSVLLSKMKQRQASLAAGSPPQDVLGCLLAAQHAARGGLRARYLTDTHLLMTVGDIFGAGVETTSTVLRWIIAYLVTYPKIQAAIQAELDIMLEGAFPCLADQVRLPLLQATIWEVLRSRPVSPIFIPHVALTNTTLGGFHIARGTRVLVNLYALHHDPTAWDDPEQFQPGRFLSSDGLQVTPPRPHFLPFGAGPRGCLGEALAKAEIFLLMASLLQTFTLSLPPQCPAPNLEGVHGVVLRPSPFKVCLKHRSTCA
uniref:steroid 17-alpha-hydroxylase/17,20 lyase-like isoform X1 n=1 Tax=Myxine glutinosa TaxID=7769 RepID=UPI00358F504C